MAYNCTYTLLHQLLLSAATYDLLLSMGKKWFILVRTGTYTSWRVKSTLYLMVSSDYLYLMVSTVTYLMVSSEYIFLMVNSEYLLHGE